ncbi:hypothetical protein, partial [Pseudomonas paraveronii]|uniref:hypothetical protein n=1 Tax=Pseudomonas paraveronii TaxID=3040598 RepID=UPI002AB01D2D
EETKGKSERKRKKEGKRKKEERRSETTRSKGGKGKNRQGGRKRKKRKEERERKREGGEGEEEEGTGKGRKMGDEIVKGSGAWGEVGLEMRQGKTGKQEVKGVEDQKDEVVKHRGRRTAKDGDGTG